MEIKSRTAIRTGSGASTPLRFGTMCGSDECCRFDARDEEDEKHVHPLQLDVIDRVLTLWSNPGEKVLTPFMGVGSEVYASVAQGRLGIGVELKPSYYRQAVKNIEAAAAGTDNVSPQDDLFGSEDAA